MLGFLKKPISQAYKERELEDAYPIYPGYLYIADGEVYEGPFSLEKGRQLTVGDIKKREGFVSFKNCDIVARGLRRLAVGM